MMEFGPIFEWCEGRDGKKEKKGYSFILRLSMGHGVPQLLLRFNPFSGIFGTTTFWANSGKTDHQKVWTGGRLINICNHWWGHADSIEFERGLQMSKYNGSLPVALNIQCSRFP